LNARGSVEGSRCDGGNAEEEREGGEEGDVEEKREKQKSREVEIQSSREKMIGLCWLLIIRSFSSPKKKPPGN